MEIRLGDTLKTIWLRREPAALVTVIQVKGSTPRKPGAKMIVFGDGQIMGTVGGGYAEEKIRQCALHALASGISTKHIVNMTNDVAKEGMACGGIMEVFIDVFNDERVSELELLYSYIGSVDNNEEPILVTITKCLDSQNIGRKFYITSTGKKVGCPDLKLTHFAINDYINKIRLEGKTTTLSCIENSKDLHLRQNENSLPGNVQGLFDPTIELLFEPISYSVDLWILGGGHIALPLANMAKIVGYTVTVVDDRPEFANSIRFNGADRVICESFENFLANHPVNNNTYVVIVTRGHREDQKCLERVVSQPAAYIGMIGSRRRVKEQLQELRDNGVQIGRAHV